MNWSGHDRLRKCRCDPLAQSDEGCLVACEHGPCCLARGAPLPSVSGQVCQETSAVAVFTRPTQSIKQFISKRTVWANGPKAEAVLINGHTFEGVELPAIVCARATAAIAGPLGRSNLTLTLAASFPHSMRHLFTPNDLLKQVMCRTN
jgi:hypothetical protein